MMGLQVAESITQSNTNNTTKTRRRSSLKSSGVSSSFTKPSFANTMHLDKNHDGDITSNQGDEAEPISSDENLARMLQELNGGGVSSDEDSFAQDLCTSKNKDLDIHKRPLDSKSILANLSDHPSREELDNFAVVKANEYIEECIFGAKVDSIIDVNKWESIPQYSKSDLVMRDYLGKGSFSDVFEVFATVGYTKSDYLSEARFASSINTNDAPTVKTVEEVYDEDDLDKEIDAMFASSFQTPKAVQTDGQLNGIAETQGQDEFKSASIRPRVARSQTFDHGSVHAASGRGAVAESFCIGRTAKGKRQVTYALKCLRPKIRSNVENYIIGVEDLVHETAILAQLDHQNIIKIHGRAACSSACESDGYFILLDKLVENLEDRIQRWKKTFTSRPKLAQLRAAYSIADALSYLHSNNIVFRDLKPANVGFDSMGVLKLFDFGFAIELRHEQGEDGKSQPTLLQGVCGTPRYMAPEVGLENTEGYGLPVDVYSYGIILWEICSLKVPYRDVKSAKMFYKYVLEQGSRPKISKHWPKTLKDTMSSCWSNSPSKRPPMESVLQTLEVYSHNTSPKAKQSSGLRTSLRNSKMFRRMTG